MISIKDYLILQESLLMKNVYNMTNVLLKNVKEDQEIFYLRWWADSEEKCIRAGRLSRILAHDRQRVMRRMSALSQDVLYMDVQKWIENTLVWTGNSYQYTYVT